MCIIEERHLSILQIYTKLSLVKSFNQTNQLQSANKLTKKYAIWQINEQTLTFGGHLVVSIRMSNAIISVTNNGAVIMLGRSI